MMHQAQPAILAPLPRIARHLFFELRLDADPKPALEALRQNLTDGMVVGIGQQVVASCDASLESLRSHPSHVGKGFAVPSTPSALWIWIRGADRGELVHQTRDLEELLEEAFALEHVVDAFQHGDSRDLSGYIDGTENPEGDKAKEAAISADGSSYVAIQQWVHDFDALDAMSQEQRDHTIGRRLADNEELDDAPISAHVKRTAQESFTPEAFILRRSMPWADETQAGLVFVAFGRAFDAFEALLERMVGNEDGVVDALFRFTQPVSGAYFWCPPVDSEGKLALESIGIS